MSGRKTKTIIDLAGFSFLFDRVRCGLVRSFLVRNWCGGMGTPDRRSVHLSTPGGPSPHSTPSVEPIFSWARHPLGRRRSRPSASRGTGRFSGAPSLMMSSSFDKTACDHRQFVNRALDFVHGDPRIAFGHIDWSSCDFIGKYGAGKRRFGVIVRRDSRATLC